MNSDHKEETEMKIYVVGIGPGRYDEMTGRAEKALLESDVIIGYKVYIQLIRDRFPHKEMIESPMRGEEARCDMAVEEALKGRTVSVVCGGDPGVYGMAGLVAARPENTKACRWRWCRGYGGLQRGGGSGGSPHP